MQCKLLTNYWFNFSYDVNVWLGVICIVLWVGIISLSRIYLGMHSVLDVLMGIFISVVLLATLLPFTNIIEKFFATSEVSPLFIILVPVVLIAMFPTSNNWTPTRWGNVRKSGQFVIKDKELGFNDVTKKPSSIFVVEIQFFLHQNFEKSFFIFRGDTCIVAAVFTGIELGTWFNYQFGISHFNQLPYPLSLDFNDYFSLAARTVSGLVIVGLTEFLGKFVSFSILCSVLSEDKKVLKASENSVNNTKKNFIDLSSKYFTYSLLGFNTIVLVPILFKYFNIQRDAFFHEL